MTAAVSAVTAAAIAAGSDGSTKVTPGISGWNGAR
jgi:hypothetical protein